MPSGQADLIEEAARLICEGGYADYHRAKLKAAQSLGWPRRSPLPDNRAVERAVLQRQQLFGGSAYLEQLAQMRRAAASAMQLLAEFAPRLAGSAVSGAIGQGHRVQLHLVADQPESVEILLHNRHIPFAQGERQYRLADGRQAEIPLLRMEAGGCGLDLAVFAPDASRTPPLSQIDGKPARRLRLDQLRSLLEAATG